MHAKQEILNVYKLTIKQKGNINIFHCMAPKGSNIFSLGCEPGAKKG